MTKGQIWPKVFLHLRAQKPVFSINWSCGAAIAQGPGNNPDQGCTLRSDSGFAGSKLTSFAGVFSTLVVGLTIGCGMGEVSDIEPIDESGDVSQSVSCNPVVKVYPVRAK